MNYFNYYNHNKQYTIIIFMLFFFVVLYELLFLIIWELWVLVQFYCIAIHFLKFLHSGMYKYYKNIVQCLYICAIDIFKKYWRFYFWNSIVSINDWFNLFLVIKFTGNTNKVTRNGDYCMIFVANKQVGLKLS